MRANGLPQKVFCNCCCSHTSSYSNNLSTTQPHISDKTSDSPVAPAKSNRRATSDNGKDADGREKNLRICCNKQRSYISKNKNASSSHYNDNCSSSQTDELSSPSSSSLQRLLSQSNSRSGAAAEKLRDEQMPKIYANNSDDAILPCSSNKCKSMRNSNHICSNYRQGTSFCRINFRLPLPLLPFLVLSCMIAIFPQMTVANVLPQFVLKDGQSEIVLRLKEGPATPVGSLIYKLKGVDGDSDPLTFGLRGQVANELLRIENLGKDEANLYLRKELDREVQDEYMIILTLNDGKLAEPVQQSLLLLVEDQNDNTPVFQPYQSTIKVPENSQVPQVLAKLTATDSDEGPYGQVIYKLQVEEGDEDLFTLSTMNGQAVLKLVKPLDYEKKFLHQVRIIASDRAESASQINTAVASLVVSVEDVGDVGPAFVSVSPVTRIREDIPVSSFVLQVRAVDGDRGINNPIHYDLMNEKDLFGIDSQSGIVFTKAPLDRESVKGGSYVLHIVATEQSKVTPRPSVETTVVVSLLDVNDETPTFKSESYLAEIQENSQAGVPVTFLGNSVAEVYDHDLGLNGTFRLRTEGDGGVFSVTPSEGINQVSFLIRVKNPARLDYERLKEINFSLVAEEASGEGFAKVPVTVKLTDINDEFPEFERNVYQVNLKENSAPGTTVVQVKAVDKDSGVYGTEGIRYTSLTGSIANELNLDPMTGLITVKKSNKTLLDRELSPVYYLTVEAQDNGGRGNRNTAQIVIILEDKNDNAPVFLQSRYEARIFENEKEFVSPLRFQARDDDEKETVNSEIHYSIVAGNEENWLEVDNLSGRVKVSKAFDFEKLPVSRSNPTSNVKRLNFTIRANDMGKPQQFSLSFLTLFVVDVNDNLPVFQKPYLLKTIREDMAGGTQILQTQAIDLDGSSPYNTVFYRIEHGAQDKFVIEPETGNVRLSPGTVLDFNVAPYHLLEIVALDGGGKQSERSQICNITIKDINNKPPKFEFNDLENSGQQSSSDSRGARGTLSGILTAGGGIFHARVLENSAPNTFITTILASDPDSSAVLRFTISFNASEARDERGILLRDVDLSQYFALDPVDGTLKTAGRAIDREMIESVKLAVVVEDIASATGPQRAYSIVIVQIADSNDNSPVFRKNPYYAAIPENTEEGTAILTVTADDKDLNRTIKYSLLPPKDDKDGVSFPLAIDPDSGVIRVTAKIDRESRDWLNFTVVAEDWGNTRRKGHATCILRISDINDNNPVFTDSISSIQVNENTPVGTVLAQIHAQDQDSGTFGKITYLLDRTSSNGKFSVDPETGKISVAEPLDREEQASYALVIQAFDNFRYGYATGESRNAFKQILVNITDSNDMIPKFEDDSSSDPNSCHSVTEFHEEAIITIRARDGDDESTSNAWISFKIKSGNELGLFKLEQGKNTAKVVPARSLKGFYGNYSLTIDAMDGGNPPNVATKEFKICILDFNDQKPVFISPSQNYTIRVPENATVGSTILQVRAVDSDIGNNGVVRYKFRQEFSRHWEAFNIDSTTGVLTLAQPLDREKQKIYHLRIEAFDLGIPTPLSSELDLTILVKNIDDYKPAFTLSEFVTQLTENAPPAKERIQLPATMDQDDEDEEEKKTSQVCYFILPKLSSNNSVKYFHLEPVTHILTAKVKLDREKQSNHTLMILATEDCIIDMTKLDVSSIEKTSLLVVQVQVVDVNDSPPRFIKKVFSGGVSTSTDYGTEFMRVAATDADSPPNAKLKYFIIHPITMSLSEGLSHLINNDNPLFNIDAKTGAISLAFDPQPDMKGHFVINVGVNDTGGLSDRCTVLVYLLRDDQKVKIVVRMSPLEVRQQAEVFTRTLGNVTGLIVNVDENFKYHENKDGSVDKTKTDFYIHLVHPKQNAVLEVQEVLKLIDLNIEELDDLFKDFNVLDTQGSTYVLAANKASEDTKSLFLVYATGSALFLALLLLVVISLCFAQRAKYQRQLKAATANAYGTSNGGFSERRKRKLSCYSYNNGYTNNNNSCSSSVILFEPAEFLVPSSSDT
ncbi:Cadherin-23 [Orchesella cincta]|uniref:Cadherin-23 n=1 Tax=Orchesella cincta TaxID=48709 RepID=A0A1D2NLQ7_ORCCI|nr:Cadherin-23 [Orchesella cincta]